jgi:S1-C subfamily serine protease
MGRYVAALICAVLVLCGCTAPQSSPRAGAEAHWRRVCTSLRAAHPAGDAPSAVGPSRFSAGESSVLASAAAGAGPALVQIRTRLKTPAAGADQCEGAVQMADQSGGTGIIVDRDGAILTAAHVLRGAADINVTLADGRLCAVTGIAIDPVLDLAVVRVDVRGLPALVLVPQSVAAGTPVIALATVRSAGHVEWESGVVLAPSVSMQAELDATAIVDYGNLIENSLALKPGFSGGPLLDGAGRLVGLNVAATTGGRHVPRGYALPLNAAACRAIARLLRMPPSPVGALPR